MDFQFNDEYYFEYAIPYENYLSKLYLYQQSRHKVDLC